MSLLEVAGLSVRYGGVTAVRDVSFTVEPGQVLAVLGANGAGKSSTLRAITGLERIASGRVTFDGRDVTGASAESIARLGVAHVPAGRGIFARVSVLDNLRMGVFGVKGRGDLIEEMLTTFPILREKRDQPAGELSGGQQQQLVVARALVQEPRLLMVDEMSMGLAPLVVAELFRIVGRLRDQGIAVIMVEQFVGQALAVADRVVVIEQGTVVAAGAPSELSGDDVAAAYLGGGDHSPVHVPPPPADALEGLRLDLPGRQVRELERRAAELGTTVGALLATAAEDVLR